MTWTVYTAQHIKNKKKSKNDRSKQTFLQRRHTDGQKAHEKMFNIANC